MMYYNFRLIHIGLLASILTIAQSHSWPEALNLINNLGTIGGPTGYVRNFLPRGGPGFKGDETDSFQKTQVVQGAKVCMNRETAQMQSPGFPRLQVTPGAKVALRYAENGHVSVREPGRPDAGGPVYIFGTTDGTKNPLLTDVMKWNSQGTGGDKTGKLITTQNFDDERCYENNNSPIATQRKAANPIGNSLALPNFSGLPCQNDFTVPEDAPIGKLYTIYWVWNFTFPDNKGIEIFSNCLDLEVHGAKPANKQVANDAFNQKQPAISAAVPNYFAKLAAQPSDAAAPAAQQPAPQPSSAAQSPTTPAAQSSTLLSEASDGQVHASAPAHSKGKGKGKHHSTKTVVVEPPEAVKTVYVMIEASDKARITTITPTPTPTPSPAAAGAAAASSSPDISPQSSPSTPSAPTTLQSSSTAAAAAAASASPTPSSAPAAANHLNIPLLSLGPSGAGRVAMASVAPVSPKKQALRFRRHFL